MTVFPGNYEDYMWRKTADAATLAGKVVLDAHAPKPVLVPALAAAAVKPAAVVAKLNPVKLQQMRDRHQAIEARVAALEEEIAQDESQLGNFKSAEETARLNRLVEGRRADLQRLMDEWEQVAEVLQAQAS